MAGRDRTDLKGEIEKNEFFLLDTIQYESKRETEKSKLVDAAIEYTFSLNEKYKEYGTEVWELILRCIKAFHGENGTDFLTYYKSALWDESKRWDAKAFYEEKVSGMRIDKEKLSKVKKLIRQAESQNHSITDRDFPKYVSEILSMTEREAVMYINILNGAIQGECWANEEGEEYSATDLVADDTPGVEELIVQKDGFSDLCDTVQEAYNSLQGRQKDLISRMITAKMYEIISEGNDVSRYEFFDAETFNLCHSLGRGLTAREISKSMGLKETSVSRSWKTFENKLNSRRER